MKVLIVGGVAGGASAAARLRRLDETAQIILFEKGEFISYANCGLPYYLGGTIKERSRLIVTKPELLRQRFNIDVRTFSEVTQIDREQKKVTVKNHQTGESYFESYDKLLLSPGAEPKKPRLEGLDLEEIFTLRNVADTYKIDDFINTRKPRRVLIVGAGFIGVEMAENLRHRGLDVTVVEFLDQAVASLDFEMAAILHRHLREHDIQLLLGTGVAGFQKTEAIQVVLSNTLTLETDMVILSIGIAPESHLAKEAGLALGVGGSIAVDENYATSDPDIFAVGDAISVRHLVSGNEVLIPLAGPANKQGRTAAECILGLPNKHHREVQGSAILKVFDLTAASTGLTEKQLKGNKIPYLKTYIHPSSHATYYPDSTPISMKLLFNQEGKILGAQAVGFDGVDKRMDVLATALRLGATVYDLEELELCYAPPYSSAKDPVNMLGFTAANILRGDTKVFYYDEVDGLDRSKITLLDVRAPEEFMLGTLEGAINIPVDVLRQNMAKIPKDKPVYLFCQVGLRGYVAARVLSQNGYDVFNLSGGYKTYKQAKEQYPEVIRSEMADTDDSGVKIKPAEAAAPSAAPEAAVKVIQVDACGLQCPGPIMKTAENMRSLKLGEQLKIQATDPAFASDIKVWAEKTGNLLLSVDREKSTFTALLEKGPEVVVPSAAGPVQVGNDKTMVIFSGDLDKAIAAFIIANGAAAMGRKVTMFFTFWGINILRKNHRVTVKKNIVESMFGFMMPRGSTKLGLSRMHMGGLGVKMIRGLMKQNNVTSLEDLIQSAINNGVKVLACQMSMGLMGIKEEELLDGVEMAGVATFLGSAETSDTNLFI
jgi:NADPH-dependent 2,4-dienoyl-CoA reductase/sulfur reductase-like enzyme/peroxiredoxin family protein/TusA-related sulfurtransferase/rhodanese-related sulfurtransferase